MKRLLISAAWIPALALTGWLVSCGSNNNANLQPLQPANLTYASVRANVLAPKCGECHGLAGGLNVDSYASVQAHLAEIKHQVLEVTDRTKMPPQMPLTSDQTNLLKAWLDAGAPEGTPVKIDPKPAPIALAPTFESIRQNILVPKCQICHSPVGRVSKIPLMTAADLGTHLIAGQPDKSELVDVITRTDRRKMPPEKSRIAPLSADEVTAVRGWIQAGALP